MGTATGRPSEDDLIARYFAPLAGSGGLGLKDDAALITPRAGHDLVVTVDALVAGVHFFAADPPDSIALKALNVNLSDLAAKGAAPVGFLLGLALPADWTAHWLERFAAGLGAAAMAGQCPLLGGDTVRTTGPLTLSITAFGEVPAGKMVKRTAARAGDVILVSGTVGDAALGLHVHGPGKPDWAARLAAADRDFLSDRYLHPRARQGLAPLLQASATAAMDVSDGLVGDCAKMMRACGLGATIDLDLVPLSRAARACVMADPSCLALAMTGGDDYEILCTAPADRVAALVAASAAAGAALVPIGETRAGPADLRILRGARDVEFPLAGFSHF